jgi:CO/xanthine dehydrogenase FAD-binding subunit
MTATDSRAHAPLPAPLPPRLQTLAIERRAMRWVAIGIPPLLAGYALFDKGFAYIRIPDVPIFFGEILMLACLAAACIATPIVRRGLEHSTVAKLLVLFAVCGLARTVPNVGTYGLNAVRDAALWYYSLVAIVVCALVIHDRDLVRRWSDLYRRFVPWLLALSVFSLLLERTPNRLPPIVPGSNFSFWDHKPANIAVQLTIAVAFLWLVPGSNRRTRSIMTAFATLLILAVATQSRSGFVAAAVGLAVVCLFATRRVRLAFAMISTVGLLFAVAWGANVHVNQPGTNRQVSVEQFVQNLKSLKGGGSNAHGQLATNVEFRDQLWSGVIKKVKSEKRVLTGLGFGPNIAASLGFQGQQADQLRSPHNSHLDVFARMGLIGAAIWFAIWLVWLRVALRARRRLRAQGRALEAGLVEFSIVGVTAILVNAYFDPTLEGPQVALWLWVLVGFTMGLVAISRRATASPA